jgi:hypothetical protein
VPGAVIGALTSHVLTKVIGTGLVAKLIGAAVGFIVSTIVSKAFADKPEPEEANFGAFEQSVRDNLITIRQPITHWQWIYGRTRVGGALTFAHESADGNTHLIITLAGHVSQEIEAIWFDDQVVPLDGSGNATGTFAGYVRIKKSLGDESGQPFPDLVAESNGKWTDAHRQTGRTKIYVRLTPNPDLFPTGIPNITAVVKGNKVYDPRSATTAYSTNASLCINHLMCSPVWGGCTYAEEIDETQLIAAANIDDEDVTLAAGGTEDRYTINGAFPVNSDTRTALQKMLSANAGRVYYLGGVFRIHPAAYASPTITLDEDSLRGVPKIEPRLSSAELCNRVKGVYVSEGNDWQPSDFPPVTNATYLSEDNGEPSWRELDLPFTKTASACQRIAKIELERVRQQISVVWPGKFSCYRLQPGDTVQLTFAMLGWSAKVFEVVGTDLIFEDDGAGGVRLGCDLTLRETASTVFDWSSGEETTVDAAPDTNLPSPFTVTAPGAPTVTETKYETRDGRGVGTLATLEIAAPTDSLWSTVQFEYRLVGATNWTVIPPSEATLVVVPDIPPGIYDFRAKVINGLGVSSAYATTRKELVGLYDRPATPTIRGLQVMGGLAVISLDPHPDLDVRRGGRWRVRHCEDEAGAWEESFSIGEEQGYIGDQTVLVLPLKPGAYLIKAEDSTGQQSVVEAVITTKQASVLAFSTLETVIEDSGFAGTHSNTVALEGILKLSGAGAFDDIADLDAIASLDSYGGVEASGTYTFSTGIDLGSVTNVRLTGRIEGIVVNVNDLFDARAENIDSWLDFDGTAGGGSADAWLEVRETDDDPSGTPVWSEWKRLDASEFSARAFQFRLQMASSDPSYNQHVTALRVTAAAAA